jgi:hypothetical protein
MRWLGIPDVTQVKPQNVVRKLFPFQFSLNRFVLTKVKPWLGALCL